MVNAVPHDAVVLSANHAESNSKSEFALEGFNQQGNNFSSVWCVRNVAKPLVSIEPIAVSFAVLELIQYGPRFNLRVSRAVKGFKLIG